MCWGWVDGKAMMPGPVPRGALQVGLLLHPKIRGFLHPWLSNLPPPRVLWALQSCLALFNPKSFLDVFAGFLYLFLHGWFKGQQITFSRSVQVSSPINKPHISHQWAPCGTCVTIPVQFSWDGMETESICAVWCRGCCFNAGLIFHFICNGQ